MVRIDQMEQSGPQWTELNQSELNKNKWTD